MVLCGVFSWRLTYCRYSTVGKTMVKQINLFTTDHCSTFLFYPLKQPPRVDRCEGNPLWNPTAICSRLTLSAKGQHTTWKIPPNMGYPWRNWQQFRQNLWVNRNGKAFQGLKAKIVLEHICVKCQIFIVQCFLSSTKNWKFYSNIELYFQ